MKKREEKVDKLSTKELIARDNDYTWLTAALADVESAATHIRSVIINLPVKKGKKKNG